MTAVLIIGLILIVYGSVSAPLDRRGITSAIAFVAVGFVVGASGLGLLDVSLESTVAERITELALVFLLFSDSARLDLGSLRRDLRWPRRLLLVGLPLTMVVGLRCRPARCSPASASRALSFSQRCSVPPMRRWASG